ncbi:EF-hand domain-containing family member C2 [Corythoichthys intestinalis]|uniref:EF-hand domain-containing family member C2 n=1 Tax=Corythoichthys intestinalis TaxID=161448 RepID=UPI0025A50892|nr:EF-hand domain-containing family member C2 [Corythoichthys intestinalis]XP_061799939.1 EF-hand domain-containing family member C2-like [Nerophis lumbriciformis]
MASPFLPGNSPNMHLLKDKFHKSQHFDYISGVLLTGIEKPGIGGELLPGQRLKPKSSVYPKAATGGLPSWVAFDKQALCFEAYFQEAVPDAPSEMNRIRKCKIYFYLEDDTIQVVEPEYKNSGIPQGTLIRRQRIPLPPPKQEQFYNVFHFNLQQQMVLFSHTFTVTNCDQFTRNFLAKCGVILNDPVAVPEDPYRNLREKMEKSMSPLRPYEKRDTLRQFLEHDRKVLRFFCFWDDTQAVCGDLRELVLHYFLADDTIEIREVIQPNSGRASASKFLRRSKLPKQASNQLNLPGEVTNRTVLNVLASSRKGDRFLLDSLKTGAIQEEFYKDCDLKVGGELNVWGRKVTIADCDDFTKDYYRSKYGTEVFNTVQYKAPVAPKPPRLVPPYNGFGSEEDSLSSCQHLLPKPPQKDLHKFMEYERCGLESNVLKFYAKMVTTSQVDSDREFIISFYLSDDSISVFERTQKNSGVLGGMFLARGRIKKPGQELFKSEPSEYFAAQDLHVGAILDLNNRLFQLLDADEYTFKYLEQHAEQFPKANIGSILAKLRLIPEEKQREIRNVLTLSDPTNTGFVTFDSFRSLLMASECGLSEHEVLVLGRSFSEHQQPEMDLALMLAVAQDVLKKKDFDQLPDMTRLFEQHDLSKTGRASTKEAMTICKAFQLPLSDNLLTSLLEKFADGDQIDYHAFLAGINWLEHPAPPVMPDDTLKFNVRLRREAGGVKNINYSSLVQEVFPIVSNAVDPDGAASA